MRAASRFVLVAWVAAAAGLAAPLAPQPHPAASGKEAAAKAGGHASTGWSSLDAIVERSIARGETPGAVLIVGHGGKIVYQKAYGYRQLEPTREKMTMHTIFDLASLTKVVATTPAMMQLLQEGYYRLNDPVAKFIPAFAVNGKGSVTIRQLFTHYSGLPPDVSMNPPWSGYEAGMQKAIEEKLQYPPGSHFRYSDINFNILADLVQVFSGERIDRYALQHVWKPLGMNHTRYLPPASWVKNIAPTNRDPRTGRFLKGVVMDPTARAMGGVAGNAGVFSTAGDIAIYAQTLLNGGVGPNGHRILSRLSVLKMTTPQTPFNNPQVRGLGWDIDSVFSSIRGDLLPVGSYGHDGYTGTSLWIDPTSDTYVVILANYIHPTLKPRNYHLLSLRAEICNRVATILDLDGGKEAAKVEAGLERMTGYNEADAAMHRTIYRNGQVRTGLDVLKARNFDLLRGKRVGLVSNQSGIDRDGNRDLDDMLAAGIDVAAGFSPEHGWNGVLDTNVGNSRDAKTGIPVFSAYAKGPDGRMLPEAGLKRVNALVYDIQDVGVRFYTFETTLANTLKAGKARGIPVYVLDRPNPIDGIHVQGPPLAAAEKSFVGYDPGMPVRNGMTIGELAKLFNRRIGADLIVVPMQGWSRGDFFDETGLPWVNPSPNLRNLTETVLYPGLGMIEGTNVSVGRGTDTPFEVLGAPWIDGRRLSDYLNARRLQGIRFMPYSFTPSSSHYAHQLCHGIYMIVVNRERLDSPELGVEIASALFHLYPTKWESKNMHRLGGSQALVDKITSGEDPRRIAADWQTMDAPFEALRKSVLIYH